MKITAYNRDHNIDLSGSVGVTSITYASTHTALGSNTPLADSGAGTPGSGPQASAWDHVHPASASSAFGSNSTRVSSSPAAGASSSNSRADHVHDGIGTATASSSNTLNRGTVHLRPGTGIALALSNTDGGSGFDTVTIQNVGSGSGGGAGVTSISKSGSSALTGAVTLSGGTNVTLTQSGQDISIAASSGSSILGRAMWAEPYGTDFGVSPTNTETLATSGGSIAIPMAVTATMDFDEVFLRNMDSTGTRTLEYRLYYDDGTSTAVFVTGTDGTFSFSPGAASDRTSAPSGAPVALGPGVYWLVLRNTSATNTFALGYGNLAATYWNQRAVGFTKSGVAALGSTLSFASGWSGQARSYGVRLTGALFGGSL